MLSYPTPCLEMIFNFLQFDKISEDNLAVLSAIPSTSANSFFRELFSKLVISNTVSKKS